MFCVQVKAFIISQVLRIFCFKLHYALPILQVNVKHGIPHILTNKETRFRFSLFVGI